MIGARILSYQHCRLARQSKTTLVFQGLFSTNRQVMVHGSCEKEMDIAIIGGGIAGISAADYLVDKSQMRNTFRVALFDKGMSLGGRCSGRQMGRAGEQTIHHGCQLLYPQSQGFRELCGQRAEGIMDGLVVIDSGGKVMHRGNHNSTSSLDAFVGSTNGVGGNIYGGYQASRMLDEYFTRVSSKLSSVHNKCAVTELSWSAETSRPWRVYAKDSSKNDQILVKDYHAVIIADWTAVMDLLVRPQKIPRGLQQTLAESHIEGVEYLPTFALIVEIHSKDFGLHDALGFETAIVHGKGTGPLDSFKMLALQAAEQTPDGTTIEYWVLLTSETKSQELVSTHPMYDIHGRLVPQTRPYRQALAQDVEVDFRAALDILLRDEALQRFNISQSFGHRWGRAFTKPGTEVGSQSVYVPQYGLGICGDMFAPRESESPVERAWQSGQAVSANLTDHVAIKSKI